jgi:drug/metabolite transporter (DMT)-like permease
MSIIGLRALLAALVFAVYRRSLKIDFTAGNVIAGLCLACTTILFVFANQLTTAAAAILLQFTSPIFVLLIRFVFYKQRPKFAEIVAVSVTIAGMVLFFADELSSGGMLGNIIAIGSGLAFAGVIMGNKRPDTDPNQSIMLGFTINAIVWSPFAFFDRAVTFDLLPWVLLIIMGVVQVGLAYVFFSLGIRRTTPLLAVLTTALEPILNPIWVALATPERPGRFALMGGIVIIVSIVGFNIWELRGKKEKS